MVDWYNALTKPAAVDTKALEQSISSLPPEMQAKIRALSSTASVELPPEPTEEERKAQVLARCLQGLKNGNLISMMKEIKAGNVRMEQPDEAGDPLLHLAMRRGEVAIVRELLELCPVDLKNSNEQTALNIAVGLGALDMIKLLLDRGADIETRDKFHYSLLHVAVQNRQLLAFLCLLQRGASLASVDLNGCSLVHWAAYTNNLDFLRLLKGLKLPMNMRSLLGMTPLHMACQGNASEAYWFLVQEGLDQDELSKEQATPLDVLKSYHGAAGVKRLLRVGAKRDVHIPHFALYYLLCFLLCCYFYYSRVIAYTAQYLLPSLALNLGLIFLPILFVTLMWTDAGRSPRRHDSLDTALGTVRDLFEAEKFLELTQLEKICFTCNAFRMQRSRHCRYGDACIPKFDHYCRELNLCVGANNRRHFVLTLSVHTAVLTCYLLLELLGFYVRTDDVYFTKKFVIVAYAICSTAPAHLLFLVCCALAWWHSLWYCFAELFSISHGLTLHEEMNRHRCRYLFAPCSGIDEAPKLRYKNPFHHGFFRNWVDFLAGE